MAGVTVTHNTIQPLLSVYPVIDLNDFLFNSISQFQHLFMTVEAPLRSEGIIGRVFIRHELVGVALETGG